MFDILFKLVLFIGTMMAIVILGAVVGGSVSWLTCKMFPVIPNTINTLLHTSLTGFELGLVLGFVGGFFRSSK